MFTLFQVKEGEDTKEDPSQLELAFEYLIGKDKLRWIVITSDQAILMSLSLQDMVDELLLFKRGGRIKRVREPTLFPVVFDLSLPLFCKTKCKFCVCKWPDTQGLKATSRCGLQSTIFPGAIANYFSLKATSRCRLQSTIATYSWDWNSLTCSHRQVSKKSHSQSENNQSVFNDILIDFNWYPDSTIGLLVCSWIQPHDRVKGPERQFKGRDGGVIVASSTSSPAIDPHSPPQVGCRSYNNTQNNN